MPSNKAETCISTYLQARQIKLSPIPDTESQRTERPSPSLGVVMRYVSRMTLALISLVKAGALFTIAASIIFWIYELFLHNQMAVLLFDTESLEAFLNVVILASIVTWFLMNLEARLKRKKILSKLNELRSFCHIIDMHQLSKDPFFSDELIMPEDDLIRYLDY